MSKIALVWIGAILCSAAFSQSVVTASLSGTVFGSNGLPVGGAVVTASRTSVVPWTTSRASSALDGSFALSGLAQGTLRANIDETESAAIITEQGGQENHRERSQDGSSFCNQFA